MISFFTCKSYRIDCVTKDHLFIMQLFIVQRQHLKKNLNNLVNTNKKINLLWLTKSKTSIFFHRKKMQKTVTLTIFHSEQCTKQWCRTIKILRAFRHTSKELVMVRLYIYLTRFSTILERKLLIYLSHPQKHLLIKYHTGAIKEWLGLTIQQVYWNFCEHQQYFLTFSKIVVRLKFHKSSKIDLVSGG